MFFLLLIIAILLSFTFYKSRAIFYYYGILLFIIMCFNSDGPDYEYYHFTFEYGVLFDVKFSYSGLVTLIKHLFEFEHFVYVNVLLSGISLCVILFFIYKFSLAPNIVLIFMTIFPFLDYIIQKRNFLGLGMIYIAFLVVLTVKRSLLRYFIPVLLIIGSYYIHSSLATYAIFFLPLFLSSFRAKLWSAFFIVLGFCILSPLIPSLLAGYIETSKIEMYLNDESFRMSIVALVSLIAFHFCYVWVQYVAYLEGKTTFVEGSMLYRFNEFALIIAIISIAIIPIYYYNAVFYRIPRNLYPILYISFFNIFLIRGYKFSWRLGAAFLMLLFLSLSSFVIQYLIGSRSYELLIEPIINNNVIFNLLKN